MEDMVKYEKQKVIRDTHYWFFLFIFFGFMTCQDYFTHFEPSQVLGEAKMGDPREKNHWITRKLNLPCLKWPELGSNPQRWDDEWFRVL